MKTYFHTTLSCNRESILEHGLEPRDTVQHNFVGCDEGLPGNAGVEAVYAHETIGGALDWAATDWRRDGATKDVWGVVLPDEAPVDADPHWCGGARVLAHVPPERLCLTFTDLSPAQARSLYGAIAAAGAEVPF